MRRNRGLGEESDGRLTRRRFQQALSKRGQPHTARAPRHVGNRASGEIGCEPVDVGNHPDPIRREVLTDLLGTCTAHHEHGVIRQ